MLDMSVMGLYLKVYQQLPFSGNYILESFNFVVPRCNHKKKYVFNDEWKWFGYIKVTYKHNI